MVHRFNPASMAAPFSPISQGVEVEAGERTIYVARQVGVRPDGTMSDDMEGQTEQIFLNIQTILRERSIDLEDLIETRTYVTARTTSRDIGPGGPRCWGRVTTRHVRRQRWSSLPASRRIIGRSKSARWPPRNS